MTQNTFVIGVEPSELSWLRKLVALLRHPDPGVRELTRHALIYLTESAATRGRTVHGPLNHAG